MFRQHQVQKCMVLAGAIIVFSVASAAEAQQRAGERVGAPTPSERKLYAGEPLEVWRKRFGELKPTSDYAAILAPGLLEIVADREAPDSIRERAATTLGRIGKPAVAAVPVLGEILADSNEPLLNRVWAGRALGYFGKYAAPVADELIAFLFDENVPLQHRPVPVEALGLIGSSHPNVVPALLRLFHYSPPESGHLSSGDATVLRELATEAFALMKEEADVVAPLLIRAIRDPSETESIRRKSVVAIGQIGPNAAIAIPVLLESLEFDPSEAVRDEAAGALAKIGEPAYFVMQRYLAHPDQTVRWRMAVACGEIKAAPTNIVAAVQQLAADPEEIVRISAVESLNNLAAHRTQFLPTAIQLLTSEDRQIRMRAMRLIVELRPLSASEIATIEELASGDVQATSRIARLLLKKLKDSPND
ncbi:MAG: HEAT repeat domain-containing protein [Planctomycetaceae bacterium]|nr:HEAT repeat domain-containing protein [Planctomycetales bacterium]MCB9874835.1 HEAT repeat domain-containing protein [Planctomycetaceae bacterium]HRX82302.1 HEAT repeat domain-containing protein [Pirellulaceae bacterium]